MKILTIKKQLQKEIGMDCKVYELGQDVHFFGTELECLRLSYKYRNLKESKVDFSQTLNSWNVYFPEWFSLDFSQKITK